MSEAPVVTPAPSAPPHSRRGSVAPASRRPSAPQLEIRRPSQVMQQVAVKVEEVSKAVNEVKAAGTTLYTKIGVLFAGLAAGGAIAGGILGTRRTDTNAVAPYNVTSYNSTVVYNLTYSATTSPTSSAYTYTASPTSRPSASHSAVPSGSASSAATPSAPYTMTYSAGPSASTTARATATASGSPSSSPSASPSS